MRQMKLMKQLRTDNEKLVYVLLIGLVIIIILLSLFIKKIFFSNYVNYDMKPSKPVETTKGYGVSASHPLAVKAGMEILENGGNAIDAAIAVAYALGVVEPYGSGLGGGGEMVVYFPDNKAVVYEYREKAPLSGNISGPTGVPGFVKGMETIHSELGSMEMSKLLEPAITLAEKGFKVDPLLTMRLQSASSRINKDEASHFYPNGVAIQPGEILVQEELAETLKKIQNKGEDAFYNGEIAKHILKKCNNLSWSDFKNYSIIKTDPVYGEFAGFKVIAPPPPISGITTLQTLKMAEKFQYYLTDDNSVEFVQVICEISKVAYNDRLYNIGDPAYFNKPYKQLVSDNYIDGLVKKVSLNKILNQDIINDSKADEEDYSNTTHFVVVDKNGMMVSATHTLSNFFGTGNYVDGFFLNNQLENFSYTASSPNVIKAGKRPRSYISPMILVNDDKVIGIGSPGGKRIPMVISQVLIRHIMLNQPIQDAINSPRFYIENNKLFVEYNFPVDVLERLESKGYSIYYRDTEFFFGGVNSLVIDKENNMIYGGADSRRNGYWLADKYVE